MPIFARYITPMPNLDRPVSGKNIMMEKPLVKLNGYAALGLGMGAKESEEGSSIPATSRRDMCGVSKRRRR
jgi:hypothetical protein